MGPTTCTNEPLFAVLARLPSGRATTASRASFREVYTATASPSFHHRRNVDAAKKTSPTRNPQQKLVSPDDAPPPPRPYRPRRPPVNSYAVSVNVCEPPLTPTPWRLRSPTAVIVRVRAQVVVTDTPLGVNTASTGLNIDVARHPEVTPPS